MASKRIEEGSFSSGYEPKGATVESRSVEEKFRRVIERIMVCKWTQMTKPHGIEPLKRNMDYFNWKTRYVRYLRVHGLDALLEADVDVSSIEDASIVFKLNCAVNSLLSVLDNSMFDIVQKGERAGSIFQMWKALETHFQGTQHTKIAGWVKEFYNLKMSSKMSLTYFIGRMETLCANLATVNEEVSETRKMVIFYEGLHERYASLIGSMKPTTPA